MKAALAALLLAGIATAASAAMPRRDPDWPCQQIRMADLSVGTMWTGPDLTAAMRSWQQDATVAALAERISERRLPVDQAKAEIRSFADSAGTARKQKLLLLAAGVFATLDQERSQVIVGLDRFGRRQKELASDIRAQMQKLRAAQSATESSLSSQAGPLSGEIGWKTRLFEQRRDEIAAACDVPSRIERRLYVLEQTIQGLLS